MSTLKTNAAQIGQSATATNNFTLYQPTVPDGTVRLGVGNAGSVTDAVILNSARNVGIGKTPNYTLDVNGTTNATTYRKSGVAGKLLVKSQHSATGTNYSTSGFTNVVLSNTINYDPVSPNSEVWVTITAFISFDQTGGDNDVAGTLYAYSFQSNGTTRISAVGLTDAVTDNSVGFVDMTTNGEVRHCITIQGQCERASDGEVYVRLWGALGADGTSGFAATMEMTICDFVFKEYL
jgi:hypothetical protein